MARPSYPLVEALRITADRLEQGAYYQWTHQGSCNCGHLAQTITKLTKSEIHKIALEKEGNWADKTIDYCKTSGFPIDHVISSMLDLGMTTEDISNLEKLACPKVLKNVDSHKKPLRYNDKGDVILYMRIWADLLEQEIINSIKKENTNKVLV
ncbi:hypothetical protein EON78_01370 [bacterium]|nr:MAG: hypothetical protein EON78_01370 [bacterium]